mmetsp:Transcript_106634/g.268069  ORF Transcript_106634/g.268069 Transcript_106634/m.268069 type:complete len:82 (+) Transcript_106634:3731-3976(+)
MLCWPRRQIISSSIALFKAETPLKLNDAFNARRSTQKSHLNAVVLQDAGVNCQSDLSVIVGAHKITRAPTVDTNRCTATTT